MLRLPFPVGDAGGGLCGGMVFAALDLFRAGLLPPADADPPPPGSPLFRHLCRRLLASFDLPFGVLRYYDRQRRPDRSRFVGPTRVLAGVLAQTVEQEWPKVQPLLDAGLPAPLGLVNAHSFDPRRLGENHQVLAYAYDRDGGRLRVRVYDPNYPGDDGVSLTLDAADPDAGRPVEHSREGPTVRGFFLTEYRPPAGEY